VKNRRTCGTSLPHPLPVIWWKTLKYEHIIKVMVSDVNFTWSHRSHNQQFQFLVWNWLWIWGLLCGCVKGECCWVKKNGFDIWDCNLISATLKLPMHQTSRLTESHLWHAWGLRALQMQPRRFQKQLGNVNLCNFSYLWFTFQRGDQ
jgi:hypothetical protein